MRKWILAGMAAVLVVGGGIVYFSSSGGSSDSKPLLITATAQPRDLRDEVTVQGTLGRVEQRTVNSVNEAAQVSQVYLDDGATLTGNEAILALDGRDSVTAVGAFAFFRKLDVGAEGTDVRQLEQILKAAGYSPGTVDQLYTVQTSFALAQWQAAHNYPGATPQTTQTVNVALQQGAGYELGQETSAGLTIGPPPIAKAAAIFRPTGVSPAVGEELTIVSTSSVVNKPAPATFVVSASVTSPSPISFTVSLGGTATSNDVIAPVGSFTLPANAPSTTIQILTKPDTLVEPNKTLTVSLDADPPNYSVGSPGSATTTIVSHAVPQLTLTGSTTVQQGQSATITVTADQAPLNTTQVGLNVGGSATPGTDYASFPPVVTLAAGRTTTTLTITTKTSSVVKPNRSIVIGLAPAAAYTVGPVNTATITIAGASGDAARPVVTITAGNLRITAGQGQPAQFTIALDRALSEELQVNIAFGGDAVAGSDYNPPGGLLTVPPGQTALPVTVPILDNGLVQPDKLLVVSVLLSPGYVVGDPGAALSVIVSTNLPEVNIVGGPAAVGLGGGAVFTIIADQPPIKDTSISYTVTGSAKQGTNIVPLTGTAFLPAGETSVTVPVLTLNTNVYFVPTDIIAGKYPTRLGEVFVEEGDVVVAGKPLFSLTETSFAVTLDTSAADRTKLKVGQSVTVQLQGGDGTAPGVISELDDNVTTDPDTKKQTYKGTVQVEGELGAADGAPVTIEVVLEERVGALTVPIAAVKQNGSGDDVVRVIDLDHGGRTREVRVKTGLSEGSYIEIQSGLRANQVVVVEVDQGSQG
ncbi:MAG: Calx-beta domain-containing protein [Acidimicrobiia bacterium]